MCRPSHIQASDAPVVVAPQKKFDDVTKVPSGLERCTKLVQLGLVTLCAIYGSVYYVNPSIPVASKYCHEGEEEPCQRPDLVAYKVTSLLAMTLMGLMGVYNWHFNPQLKQLAPNNNNKTAATSEDRLFAYLSAADYCNVVILSYQIWDLVLAFQIPENWDPLFLLHHVMAIITAYCALEYQMMPYYSIYYGGCSEFSSIFLILLDKDQMFVGCVDEKWLLVFQGMFFLTFSYYRIFGWISHSVPLFKDCDAVLKSGSLEQHRPGKTFVLRLFLGLDVVLGLLQCYWYSEILKAVFAIAS